MDKVNNTKTRSRKNLKPERISIEFDKKHLPILISALETYSRLQSGQIDMAMDIVYADRNLSWDERKHIEGTIRYMAFPANPRREYDGHGGFFDQYCNEYNENGVIIKESGDWKSKKNRPHLDHPNSSFGVGCKEMNGGTAAWEIKKAIEQFLHYERNNGYRDMGVDGDGVLNITGIPNAKIIDPQTNEYWQPIKLFKVPKRFQDKIKKLIFAKSYKLVWSVIEQAFKKTPLPRGTSFEIKNISDVFYVAIKEPHKPLI